MRRALLSRDTRMSLVVALRQDNDAKGCRAASEPVALI